MLYQIVLGCSVYFDVGQQFSDSVKLVISWENDSLGTLHLPSFIIFLFYHLDEHELIQNFDQKVLFHNVIPHIMGSQIAIFKNRVARTCIHSFSFTNVERQEEGIMTINFGSHVGDIRKDALRRAFGMVLQEVN